MEFFLGCHREVSVQQNIVYRQVGDTQLELDLYFPLFKPKNPRPAVIVLHGGAWRHGDKGDMMEVAIKLAKRGYVVASVGYRFAPAGRCTSSGSLVTPTRQRISN